MSDAALIAKIAREIERQARNPRFIGRRSLDKTCGEVVESLKPGSPLISDKTQRVVQRINKPNFDGETAAQIEAEKRNRRHLAYTILQITRGNR